MKGFGDLATDEVERLIRYIRRKVDSIEDSEDIMQETFLALYRRWNVGEPIEDALAWLFRTARNKIVDSYRREGRKPVPLGRAQSADPDASDLWELADARVSTPQEEAEREELRAALLEAIRKLPDDQRQAFLLNEVEGLRFKEIERRTGVPLNTLLSRKRYAVLKLRSALSEWCEIKKEV